MKGTVGKDLGASLVVFLVALPLSLGISVASGAPLKAGLIAAVVGGIVVGLLGGAPLQVSGPAAGLTVMVFGMVQQLGLKALGVVVVLAGLMQAGLGLARMAKVAMAISPAVLHAMLAGIGILITLGQVHVLLGFGPRGSALQNLATLPEDLAHLNPSALAVGLFTLTVLVTWNRFLAKRVKAVPGSLVAIVAGTLLSMVLPSDVPRVALGDGVLDGFSLPSADGKDWGALLQAAVGLMVVASAESLLCAVATDQLHKGPRANLDRELFAQGLGNALSGLLGGLPITGVIVRSSANISAGAQTRLSAILHGVWLAVFVLVGTPVLARLPMAALAALLVHVGINLVKVKEIRKIAEFNEALVYVTTLVCVVFINLLWGIGIGFGLALVLLLKRVAQVNVRVTPQGDKDVEVRISGNLSFLAVPVTVEALRSVPPGKTVRLEFELDGLDHAAVEAVRAWRSSYENAGGKVQKQPLDALWRELSGRPA